MARSRGRRLRERLRERNPFPEGSATIGLWLIVGGVTAYLFLAVSGQVLGSERYSALAVLWVIAFTAAPGFFQPLVMEQIKAILVTLVLAIVGTTVIAFIVKAVTGLRAREEVETIGLDLSEHGEQGYHG